MSEEPKPLTTGEWDAQRPMTTHRDVWDAWVAGSDADDIFAFVQDLGATIAAKNEELERLAKQLHFVEEELADRDEQHRRVMAEECPSDEHHCACVPVLREAVKDAEDAYEHEHKLVESQMKVIGEQETIIRRLREDKERLILDNASWESTCTRLKEQLAAAEKALLDIVVGLTEFFRHPDDKIEDAQSWYADYRAKYPEKPK